MIRQKEVYSGKLLEVDFYPVNRAGRKLPDKIPAPRSKAEIEAQRKYEKKRSTLSFIRKVNANFDKDDFILTVTYEPRYAPLAYDRAEKDIKNYFARIKRLRAKELKRVNRQLRTLPRTDDFKELRNNLLIRRRKLTKPMLYARSVEQVKYKTGKYAGKPNYHFHIIMSGGLTAEQIESKWNKGFKVNAVNYKPDVFGPEAAARYMTKGAEGKKSFKCSKYLKKCTAEKIKDRKRSRDYVRRLCEERGDDKIYWEAKFKNYRLLKTYPRFNQYNGCWYLSVVMYKTDGEAPPPWELE